MLADASSSRLLSWTAWNRRAFSIASTDWLAKVWSRSTTAWGNSPGVLRRITSAPTTRLLADQRHGQQGPEPGPAQDFEGRTRPEVARREEVRHLLRLAEQRRSPDDVVVREPQPILLDRREQLGRHAVGRPWRERPVVLTQLVDGAGVGAGQADGVRHDGGQHLVQVERGRDGLADLTERLELADAGLKLLEQSGVLDGDDGLVSELSSSSTCRPSNGSRSRRYTRSVPRTASRCSSGTTTSAWKPILCMTLDRVLRFVFRAGLVGDDRAPLADRSAAHRPIIKRHEGAGHRDAPRGHRMPRRWRR